MSNVARVKFQLPDGSEGTMDLKLPIDDLYALTIMFRDMGMNEEDVDFVNLALSDATIELFLLDVVSYGLDAIFEKMNSVPDFDHPRPDKQVDALIKKWGIKNDSYWGSMFLVIAESFSNQLQELNNGS